MKLIISRTGAAVANTVVTIGGVMYIDYDEHHAAHQASHGGDNIDDMRSCGSLRCKVA